MENVEHVSFGRRFARFVSGCEQWLELAFLSGIVVYFVVYYVIPFCETILKKMTES